MDDLLALHDDHIFLRREAIERGYDDKDLRRSLRAGDLAKVRHGAYTSAGLWASASPERRHQLKAHAVVRSHATPIALSHTSAAVEHELRLFRPDLSKVHVTSLDRPLARTTKDVVYHCASSLDDIETRAGIPVVPPARAAVETATLGTVQQGLVVLDSALDLTSTTPSELAACYLQRAGWPNSRQLQISLRLTRPGSNSVGESLMRYLMWTRGLPEPDLQYEVMDPRGKLIGRTDFAWPEYGLLGEFDGMAKYLRLRRPGETPAQALKREKVREDRIREATGWLMIRFVWDDIFKETETSARVRQQLARGRALLGR